VGAALCGLGALGVSSDTAPPGEPAPDPVRMRAFFDRGSGIEGAGALAAGLTAADPACVAARVISTSWLEDGKWVERWLAALAPFPIGRRFLVEPVQDLMEASPDSGAPASRDLSRLRLRICPSRAFGTGEHPTTRLCLIEMEGLELAGRSFLDAGTGSGILAIVAGLLGAAPVIGFDNDPEAIDVARANAALNPGAGAITFITGEPASIEPAAHEVIAANLNGTILERVIPDLIRLLAPSGHLILSGLLESEGELVAALVESRALRRVRLRTLEGWSSAHFERRGA